MKSVKVKLNFEKFKSKNTNNSENVTDNLANAIDYIKQFADFRNTSIKSHLGSVVFTSLTSGNFAQIYYDVISNLYSVTFYDRQNNEISPEVLERNF